MEAVFLLLLLPIVVQGKQCWFTSRGRTKHFFCGVAQVCCGEKCCDNNEAFYRLWYFWLTVFFLMLLCAGGVYWVRQKYIFHRLLSSSTWFAQQITTNMRQSRISRPCQEHRHSNINSQSTVPETSPIQPPPYSPPSGPPPYSVIVKDPPPVYSSQDVYCEKSRLVESDNESEKG